MGHVFSGNGRTEMNQHVKAWGSLARGNASLAGYDDETLRRVYLSGRLGVPVPDQVWLG